MAEKEEGRGADVVEFAEGERRRRGGGTEVARGQLAEASDGGIGGTAEHWTERETIPGGRAGGAVKGGEAGTETISG